MTYKAIGFDWGGVINGKPGGFTWKPIADKIGVQQQEFETAYFHHNQLFNNGKISQHQMWERVMKELGRPDEPDLVDGIVAIHSEANVIDINEKVLSLVDTLHNNGYRLGLLSNNIPENAVVMRKLGIDTHFDVFDISCETGFSKPRPEAFQLFAERLGVQMSELIFIDDTPKSLSTSSELGFEPLLFIDYETLVKSLKSLGVKI